MYNGGLVNNITTNNNNGVLEASGFDPSRLEELDPDEAFALKLQQEEYTRESLIPNRYPYFPFRVEQDDEARERDSPILIEPDPSQFESDEQYAAYLQEQEDRQRERARQQAPLSFVPIRQRSNPGPGQTTETDEPEPMSPLRLAQRPPWYHDDDDDDDEAPHMNAFIQFLANHGRAGPGGLHPIFPGFRRGYRRTGNLQDTDEDFGPEDYEVILINLFHIIKYFLFSLLLCQRLLQLDDTVQKKKLTREQINTLPTGIFSASNKS